MYVVRKLKVNSEFHSIVFGTRIKSDVNNNLFIIPGNWDDTNEYFIRLNVDYRSIISNTRECCIISIIFKKRLHT